MLRFPANKIWLLILSGALIRIVLWIVYEPQVYPDTATYVELAQQLKSLDFASYIGKRTPVYPLLMLLCGLSYQMIFIVQMLMGIANSVIVYKIFHRLSQNERVALWAGLLYNVTLSQLFFEANIITETTTTFLILLSLWALFRSNDTIESGKPKWHWLFLTGLLSSLAALTRPLFLFLPLLIFLFLLYSLSRRLGWLNQRFAAFAAAPLLPMILLVGGWCYFNYRTLGYGGISSLLGYNLTQHSGAFIESAPDEFSEIKEIYLKHRQRRFQENGSHIGTIFKARSEIVEKTGLSYVELSKVLTKMSIRAFFREPVKYLKSVCQSWIDFWIPAFYYDSNRLPIKAVAGLEIAALLFLEGVFLLSPGFWLYAHNRKTFGFGSLHAFVYVLVLATSVFQALLEHSEGARYKIPVEPLIVGMALYVLVCFHQTMLQLKAQVQRP